MLFHLVPNLLFLSVSVPSFSGSPSITVSLHRHLVTNCIVPNTTVHYLNYHTSFLFSSFFHSWLSRFKCSSIIQHSICIVRTSILV
ncbi:hypothetical protein C8Q75DRAFT_65480 [Abortiporus biennis]|nr:hypothetical protein C8Q75DRAFT_65480 [Abortiporus biennis]